MLKRMHGIYFLAIGILLAANTAAQLPSEQELEGMFAQNLALAKAGNTEAEMAVCAAYSYGIGTAPDPIQAFAFCSRASNAGDPGARLLMADFYLQGITTDVDTTAAKRLYQHAIDGGVLQGHVGLASIYFDLEEKLGTRNLELAEKHAKTAANAKLPMGEMYMGIMYLYGLEPNVSLEADIDYKLAAEWFEKSAQQGFIASAPYLVNIYYSNTDATNLRRAYFWTLLLKKYQPDTYPKDVYFKLESRLTSGQRAAAEEELVLMERRWENLANSALENL